MNMDMISIINQKEIPGPEITPPPAIPEPDRLPPEIMPVPKKEEPYPSTPEIPEKGPDPDPDERDNQEQSDTR